MLDPPFDADAIMEARVRESQLRGGSVHSLDADGSQENVGGQIVADGADQDGEIGDRQMIHREKLPKPRVVHRVLVRASE